MQKAIFIEGPLLSGKSQIVANIFYPLEDINITASVDMQDNMFEQDFTFYVTHEKKFINIENFEQLKVTDATIALIETCIENDQVLFITSRKAPPKWLKDKILHMRTAA